MRAPLPAGLLALLLALPGAASAQTTVAAPTDMARAPLERAAFVALPAVYWLEVRIHVDAVVAGRRRIAVGRDVAFRGGAVGVAPGRVVTAAHLVAPSRAQLVEAALDAVATPSPKIRSATARPITRGKARITLVRARTDAARDIGSPVKLTATLVSTSDRIADLALLGIPRSSAPTFTVDDSLTRGTPVAGIAFAGGPPPVPVLRIGTLLGQGTVKGLPDERRLAPVDLPVARGDSGGPVVDGDGRLRGVILRVASGDVPPVIASGNAVRQLLSANGLQPAETEATTDFRAAMEAFWQRRYADAGARLDDLRGNYPDDALVALESQRADALAVTGYRIESPSLLRGSILAIGAMATICAALFGALRVRRWSP